MLVAVGGRVVVFLSWSSNDGGKFAVFQAKLGFEFFDGGCGVGDGHRGGARWSKCRSEIIFGHSVVRTHCCEFLGRLKLISSVK